MTYYKSGGAKSQSAAKVLAAYLSASRDLGSVLDVGCGDGTMLLAVAQRASKLTGIDSMDQAVELTQAQVPASEVILADVEEGLPFAAQTFDTVLFCDVIEHLRQPVFSLEELFRVTRPAGQILMSTPNSDSLIRRLKGKAWFGLSDPSHVIFYTMFSLTHLLETVGFRIVKQSIEGLTGSIVDPVLRLTRTGGTIVVVAQRS